MSKFKNAIENKDLKAKYLSNGDLKIINDLKKMIKEDDFRITCMGLYNAGKSFLLNALIEDLEEKTFKTADKRETVVNKEVKYKNITFVDTPGLNAQKNDDKRVMDAVKNSDINLFVHDVNTGEFVAREMKFFQDIKKHWKDPKEFCQRTVFILSRCDEANSNEDIKNNVIRIKEQIKDVFDTTCFVVPISSKTFLEGKKENEDELIEESNILPLQTRISSLEKEFLKEIKKTKKDRLSKQYDSLMAKLSSKIQNEKLELNQLKNEQKNIDKSLEKDIKKINKTLIKKLEEI